jgi:predicted enzyme related to lactoylglutathione lyase
LPWIIDGVLVQVNDVEAHYERAKAAGATILRSPRTLTTAGSTAQRTSKATLDVQQA